MRGRGGRQTLFGDYCTNCHEVITIHNMATNGNKLRPTCKPCFQAMDNPARTQRKLRQLAREGKPYYGKVGRPTNLQKMKAELEVKLGQKIE